MRVFIEHRHPDGRTIRYNVALRRDPWGRQTSETEDLNVAAVIPWSQNHMDFVEWKTSARVECYGHFLPVLVSATVDEAIYVKTASRYLFESVPLLWRDTEWFISSSFVFSPFVSTFNCHVCSASFVYDDAIAAKILRRCAIAYTGWKRVRDILRKRFIVLYWHELTAHQMAEGGTAWIRDRNTFENDWGM